MADPEKVKTRFPDAAQAIGRAGMKTTPCLSNRRHYTRWDYGRTCTETLLAIRHRICVPE